MGGPCPCMSLQKGSMVLAIVDAVISMINLGLMIISFVHYIKYDSKDEELTKSERTVGIVVVTVLTIVCVLQVLLAFRLYNGAKKWDRKNCRIWILCTAIATIINVINVIVSFTASDDYETSNGGTLFVIIYKIYEMYVVYCFVRELNMKGQGTGTTLAVVAAPQQPYPVENGQQQIYVTPMSQAGYPMQQLSSSYPPPPPYPVTNQHYPAPVHHVTSNGIS